MKKVILFLGVVAIIVIGTVFYFLGRDYNQTLVQDKPASSSVVSSVSSNGHSSELSFSSSEDVKVPKELTLSGAQTDDFGQWIGDQAAKMNRAGSALNITMGGPGVTVSTSLYYQRVNGPLYINGTNGGRGLQAEGIFGFYVWDANEFHGMMASDNYDGTIGYQGAQDIHIGYEGYTGHIASTTDYSMDMYIVANDGNIYEFKIPQSENGIMFRPNTSEGAASSTGVVGQITQDQNAKAELNSLVGYPANKVSQSFNY